MRKVAMSEAGLRVLLERVEPWLELWEKMAWYAVPLRSRLYDDTAEAVREARDRLGLPPRQPETPLPGVNGEGGA